MSFDQIDLGGVIVPVDVLEAALALEAAGLRAEHVGEKLIVRSQDGLPVGERLTDGLATTIRARKLHLIALMDWIAVQERDNGATARQTAKTPIKSGRDSGATKQARQSATTA